MPLKVVLSAMAEEDLLAAWNFLAQDNFDAADALMDRVAAIARKLAEWPELGQARPELAQDLRSFPADTHMVYYRVRADSVEIARVLHGRRDVDAIF
jgi:toxin ParE1/3/4